MLTRRSGRDPRRSLALRAGLALGLLLTAFAILWLDRGGLRDNIDGHMTFPDVVYFT